MNWYSNRPPVGIYYTSDPDDTPSYEENFNGNDLEADSNIEADSNADNFAYKERLFLGLGDFFLFNTMVLVILPPMWSMARKIVVVVGCIISIHVGQYGTVCMGRFWRLHRAPALPFPVVTFSIYAMIVNAIMRYINNDC